MTGARRSVNGLRRSAGAFTTAPVNDHPASDELAASPYLRPPNGIPHLAEMTAKERRAGGPQMAIPHPQSPLNGTECPRRWVVQG